MDPDESGCGGILHDGRQGELVRKFLMIPGTSGSRMQRWIEIETRTAVLIFGGQTESRLAGASIWPFATAIAMSVFQGGMAVIAETKDKTECASLPAQKKDQQADDRKNLSEGLRLHTWPR